jgi:hypothetical protein
MGFFLRLKLETLSILDSERIDASTLHEAIYKAVFTGQSPPSEIPEVKAKKSSYKRLYSAASAENYMKELRLESSVWGERCFWRKINSPMAKPFAFVLYVPVPPPIICPIECLVRTGKSMWDVFRFL